MNKIISINLKGFIFQVEEEAYDRLKQYLEQLNSHFAKDESRLEIIDDIENRLAEMMQERLKTKSAITMADVEEIIAIMGNPADFETEEEQTETNSEEKKGNKSAYNTFTDDFAAKRFFRDTENSIIGGVCSGAGHYFGIDPLWIRLGFLFLFFVLGTGLLFYIILWAIIPEAKTQSDRLRMKGEKVNVDNIEKAVKEEYERVKKNFDDFRTGKGAKVGQAVSKGVGIVGDIAAAFLKFLTKLVGSSLFVLAIMLFITFVVILANLMSNGTLPVLSLAFENTNDFWLVVSSSMLLLLLIITGIISSALRLLSPRFKMWQNKAITYPTTALSVVAIVVLVIMAVKYGSSFSSRQAVTTTQKINAGDTLVISAFNPVYFKVYGEYDGHSDRFYESKKFFPSTFNFVHSANNSILNDSLWHIARFEIQRSQKDDWELEIIRSSHGQDDYTARLYAEKIPLDYMVTDKKLTLNTHFYAGKNIPYRDQEIIYRLWVPKNKVVWFEQGVTEIMEFGLKHRVTDPDNYGLIWQMGDNGLKCLDCRKIDNGSIPADAKWFYLEDFTEVDVNIPATVKINQGNDYKVAVHGPTRVKENVEIRVESGRLKVGYDAGLFDIFDGYNISDIQILITMPKLTRIEGSGANQIELRAVKGEKLTIEMNAACRLEGDVEVKEVKLEMNGSSTVELEGRADIINADITGASKLRAYDLITGTYSLDIVGASHAEINVQKEINGDVSGASEVLYKGSPSLKVQTSGASSLKAAP